jgi:hypothetical protein
MSRLSFSPRLNRTIVICSLAWVLGVATVAIFSGAPVATCFGKVGDTTCDALNEALREPYWWWPWLPIVAGPASLVVWSLVRRRRSGNLP